MKNAKTVIYKIETAKKKKDPTKLYSLNSKKAIYQSLLKMVDNLDIKLSKNARELYNDRFEVMKSRIENIFGKQFSDNQRVLM